VNILLIEDDPSCLKSLVSALEIDGHVCHAFTKAEQALEAYQQAAFDVAITDMKMPGMNGIEVLQRIRGCNPDAKVVIITAYWDIDAVIAAMNNQACAFFCKPLKLADLMAVLEKIEQESQEQERVENEHARLALEYARLKIAYEDLQASLQEKTAGKEVNA